MSLYLSTADLSASFPKPYSAIPPRRRRSLPKSSTAAAGAAAIGRPSPPPAPPVASSSRRLPTPAVDLRRAYQPSRAGSQAGPSRCVRECCERESLFGPDGSDDDDDDAAGLSHPIVGAWSGRPPRRRQQASAQPTSAHWKVLLASLQESTAPSSSAPALVSGSAESSASSLLLTPPDERPAFAFTKASAAHAGRRPAAGRDSLVQELEGGFEWALGRAIGSLKGSLATASLPIRRRRRSREDAATAKAAGAIVVAVAASAADTAGRSPHRPWTMPGDRLPVQPGSCPLTCPCPPSPYLVAPAQPRPAALSLAKMAVDPVAVQPRPRLASFFTLPPPALAFWPTTGSRASAAASSGSTPATVVLPWHTPPAGEAETYHSSLPLLPMSRPPSPTEVLRPHFPVLRPRALERYVVFGHMRRAGKIGQAGGGGGEGEWRRVRERGQPRAGGSGSGLRWEVARC
jgi:hypothetical protein